MWLSGRGRQLDRGAARSCGMGLVACTQTKLCIPSFNFVKQRAWWAHCLVLPRALLLTGLISDVEIARNHGSKSEHAARLAPVQGIDSWMRCRLRVQMFHAMAPAGCPCCCAPQSLGRRHPQDHLLSGGPLQKQRATRPPPCEPFRPHVTRKGCRARPGGVSKAASADAGEAEAKAQETLMEAQLGAFLKVPGSLSRLLESLCSLPGPIMPMCTPDMSRLCPAFHPPAFRHRPPGPLPHAVVPASHSPPPPPPHPTVQRARV